MKEYILGIETSCDDTSLSILLNGNIISCITISSENEFKKFEGIIPEIASRHHVKNILCILKSIIVESKISIDEIKFISYTSKPGLINSLHVGKIFAKTISWFLDIDLIEIDHIEAHIFSPFIGREKKIEYPFLSLIVSGGTTALFKVENIDKITLINSSIDDALGEAYDKIGRYLKLDYPGGPSIDKIFDESKVKHIYKKPKPEDLFSFSGIKSNIKNYIDKNYENLDEIEIASSFQYWAINVLFDKINFYSDLLNIKIISIGGGVSSNIFFREMIQKSKLKYYFPKKIYSCDNGAMIAFLAYLKKIL